MFSDHSVYCVVLISNSVAFWSDVHAGTKLHCPHVVEDLFSVGVPDGLPRLILYCAAPTVVS